MVLPGTTFMSAIGYLVSEYHAPSHTFVRREIAALRALGETIHPFAIRQEDSASGEDVPAVLGQSVWSHIRSFFGHLIRRPGRLFEVWGLALSHRPPGLRALIWSQFHFIEASTLARLLERGAIRHLHNHFANNGASVGMMAARLAGIDWSMTLHGISETDYPAGLLLPQKLAAARFTACASFFMRAQAMRVSEPDLWARYHIVRCGIDIERLPERSQPCRPDQTRETRIVCVGRLSPEKGYGVLAQALAQLREEGERNLAVTIVGDGPARDDVQSNFAALDLSEQVTFTGALPEAETLRAIAAADILVLPSLMEGLPVVLMEALALGVPVIASGVAGIPELVEHERTGLLVIPTDADALAKAIARLAGDPALRHQLGKAGSERIKAGYTSEESARRMQALFRETTP
jgi:glycosyltransferase involved in cell wall biosynthesis